MTAAAHDDAPDPAGAAAQRKCQLAVDNDFGGFIGWLGAVVAAGAVSWMALRERTISRWIGWFSIVPVLAVVLFAGLTGLTGFQGVVGPAWMLVAFGGLM